VIAYVKYDMITGVTATGGITRRIAAPDAECERRFGAADCCFASVLELADAVASPHVRSRGLVHRTAGGELQPLFPAVVDGEPPAPRPPLGDE